jgi:hypothetical protein
VSLADRERELADEQAAQRRYSVALRDKDQAPGLLIDPTSNTWTRTGMKDRTAIPDGCLIGRVALTRPEMGLDGASDFYIGEIRATFDGKEVYSWVAPFAAAFFGGRRARRYPWFDDVAATRRFTYARGRIANFSDEVHRDDTRHVRDVVERLTGRVGRVTVRSLPALLAFILGVERAPTGPVARHARDVEAILGDFAIAAVHQSRTARRDRQPRPEEAYEMLRENGLPRSPIAHDSLWANYLASLPPYREALQLRAHAPLLAIIKWEIAKSAGLRGIGHVIVDEAQDVTPLEWSLLAVINETDTWTLIGDLNQRRSDDTPASWDPILRVLGHTPGEVPVERLQRGYRSTRPILEYANRLLPKSERAVVSFQEDGPAPTRSLVPTKRLGDAVVEEADRLIETYPEGTVAVIATDPQLAWIALRSAGWTGGARTRSLDRDGRTITVLRPDDARGLEWDAVIVVEPADFPQSSGRQGALYTALTRANRELAIVHSKPLMQPLRRG